MPTTLTGDTTSAGVYVPPVEAVSTFRDDEGRVTLLLTATARRELIEHLAMVLRPDELRILQERGMRGTRYLLTRVRLLNRLVEDPKVVDALTLDLCEGDGDHLLDSLTTAIEGAPA